MEEKQAKTQEVLNRRRRSGKTYFVGDKVYDKSVRQENLKWFPGEIIKVVSPTTYVVTTEGRTRFVRMPITCGKTIQYFRRFRNIITSTHCNQDSRAKNN